MSRDDDRRDTSPERTGVLSLILTCLLRILPPNTLFRAVTYLCLQLLSLSLSGKGKR